MEIRWLATFTVIEGEVNSSRPEGPFGNYRIELHSSKDLKDWRFERVLIERRRNLEDGRFFRSERTGRLFFFYEEEDYDQGPSRLMALSSDDQGRTWSTPITLLDEKHDNEPAGAIEKDGRISFYFSSDRELPGKSYSGGNAFYVESKDDGVSWGAPQSLLLGERLLLLDVISCGGGGAIGYVAVQDYLEAPVGISGCLAR